MTGARDEVIARIRVALADRSEPAMVPRGYARTTPAGTRVVELFEERVADYHANVHRATTGSLGDVLAAIVTRHALRRLVIPAGIPADWLALAPGITRLADDPPLKIPELDAADGVITGCAVAIAETGTVVLDAGVGQGRRVLTLLPDHHVCVVRTDQVVGNVPEALRRLEPTRPLTWISGPSATSDIELQRVEGVHGPRVLDIVIVDLAA